MSLGFETIADTMKTIEQIFKREIMDIFQRKSIYAYGIVSLFGHSDDRSF